MKHQLGKVLPLVVVLGTLGAVPVSASTDFWDCFITNVSTGSGVSSATGRINGAQIKGTWNDLNNNGKFDPSDTLVSFYINDRNNVPVLSTPRNVTSRNDLETWAEKNALAILNALFPYGLSEITGASDDNRMSSATVGNNLFTKTFARRPGFGLFNSRAKGQSSPAITARLSGQSANAQLSSGGSGQFGSDASGLGLAGSDASGAGPSGSGASGSGQLGSDVAGQLSPDSKGESDSKVKGQLSSEVNAQLEYQDLKVYDNKGNAVSMILGYTTEASSGVNVSLTMPYTYSAIKDDINSRSQFIGMDLALKYPVKKWEKGDWKVGGALFGSAFYLKTDTIDKSGNMKYGWGAFSSVTNDLGFGTLGVGVDYRIAKAYLPSSMNSNNDFLVSAINYINNLDPVRTLSYGINLGVPLLNDAAALNLEIVRSNFMSSDIPDEEKNKTTVNMSGNYFPSDSFELNLGLSYDFELTNVKSLGVMLGLVHQF